MKPFLAACWRTFWVHLPLPSLAFLTVSFCIYSNPFAADRLDLEFGNALGNPTSRHQLAQHLEASVTGSSLPTRVIRLYESNCLQFYPSAAKCIELLHLGMLSDTQPSMKRRRSEANMAGFSYSLGSWASLRGPVFMRLRAIQLADDGYVRIASRHVSLEVPSIPGAPRDMRHEQARRIKAAALLMAASQLDGGEYRNELRRLGLNLSAVDMRLAESYSKLLAHNAARNATRGSQTVELNQGKFGKAWTLIWKSFVLLLIPILWALGVSSQLGALSVLGFGFLKHLIVPLTFMLSPVLFVLAYDLLHGFSYTPSLPGLTWMTSLVFGAYILILYRLKGWMRSRADVFPSQI